MYSFEGDHRRRPNVSLGGASKLMGRTALLDKLRKERLEREEHKRREIAAVRIQSFVRGVLCRLHTNHRQRECYDVLVARVTTPLTEADARALCVKMIHLYTSKHDGHRLAALCSLLVRHQSQLVSWIVTAPQLWLSCLAQLLKLALVALCATAPPTPRSPPLSRRHSSSPPPTHRKPVRQHKQLHRAVGASAADSPINHAGPLRLLEIVTQPKTWSSSPSSGVKASASLLSSSFENIVGSQQELDYTCRILIPLIKQGYFRQLIQLLVIKVPDVAERTTKPPTPLAASILGLILQPLRVARACRQQASRQLATGASTSNCLVATGRDTSTGKDSLTTNKKDSLRTGEELLIIREDSLTMKKDLVITGKDTSTSETTLRLLVSGETDGDCDTGVRKSSLPRETRKTSLETRMECSDSRRASLSSDERHCLTGDNIDRIKMIPHSDKDSFPFPEPSVNNSPSGDNRTFSSAAKDRRKTSIEDGTTDVGGIEQGKSYPDDARAEEIKGKVPRLSLQDNIQSMDDDVNTSNQFTISSLDLCSRTNLINTGNENLIVSASRSSNILQADTVTSPGSIDSGFSGIKSSQSHALKKMVLSDSSATLQQTSVLELLEEVFASAQNTQVYNCLVPILQHTALLLTDDGAVPDDLMQVIDVVLAGHNEPVLSESLRGFDHSAPAMLAVLLALVPSQTALSSHSLELYLHSCRRLVRRTAYFLPLRPPSSPSPSSSSSQQQQQQQQQQQPIVLEEEEDDADDDEDEDDEDDDMEVEETKSGMRVQAPAHLIETGEWCLAHINSPEYVSWLLRELEHNLQRPLLTAFCGLTHTLLTAPCLSLFHCRLMYGVVGRHKMQRAMWSLLASLTTNWGTTNTNINNSLDNGPNIIGNMGGNITNVTSGMITGNIAAGAMGNVTTPIVTTSATARRTNRGPRLLEVVSRGTPLSPEDRDRLVPVLASFATTLLAVLATLHDSELVPYSDPSEALLYGDSQTVSNFLYNIRSSEDRQQRPHFAFTVPELVSISGTLRDVCVGLAELAHPDTRASTNTDVAYKPIWDHCFKCCVGVVRQLHLRDTRRHFCPPKHWLTDRISLPALPHTASYRSLLSSRSSARRRAFMPRRWRTRAKLLADQNSGLQLTTTFEKVRATVLQELPFVFSFRDRAEVFLRLVQEDRHIAQHHSDFNVGPNISIRVRRTHLYEDSFEKLSQHNEPNMRLSLRVQLLNTAGAVEAGVDGGGLFREFLAELLKTAFDPNRGFFLLTRENTLYPNPAACVLNTPEKLYAHYYFIGRMLGKALYEKLLVEVPLAGFFLSKLLARKGFSIEFHHLDSLDPELCRNLLYLKTHKGDVLDLGLDFTVLTSELGQNTVVELVPDGANVPVTSDNKIEYIYRMADFKLNKQIAKQCFAFRKGLYDVVPAEWLQLFDWRELQTMVSGSATPVKIHDLKENTTYTGDYFPMHKTIQLFWQVVEEFEEQQSRQLLKFVTSCSRPPLLGFKDLHPPFCIQPSGSEQRLPSAATCMNLLKLPQYSDAETLRDKLLYAITSNAGFELS